MKPGKNFLLEDELAVKKTLCDMLDKVTYGQAEAILYALDAIEELRFTREFIHNNGLEYDLLSKYASHRNSKDFR